MIYRHDLDPFLVQFTESVGIRWYGIAYLLGFFVGYLLLRSQFHRAWLALGAEKISDLVIHVAIAGVLGGRIGYMFLYDFRGLLDDPFSIGRIWAGGMSIHGGLIGAVVGVHVFARREKIGFLHLADALALATPPGLMFGRLANFINGELWGRPTEGGWGVIFPRAPLGTAGEELTRHPSQLYQAALEGPVLMAILWWAAKRRSYDGRSAAIFLIAYSGLRFLVEYFREPDAHLGLVFAGLSRGQLYSLATIFAGLVLWTAARRRAIAPPDR